MAKNTKFNFLRGRVEQSRKRALANDMSSENRLENEKDTEVSLPKTNRKKKQK